MDNPTDMYHIDIDELNEKEYLETSKEMHSKMISGAKMSLKILMCGLILLVLELFFTIAVDGERGIGLVLGLNAEDKYAWVNIVTLLIYGAIAFGIVLLPFFTFLSYYSWHCIGLGFISVNTSKYKKIIDNEKNTDNKTLNKNNSKEPPVKNTTSKQKVNHQKPQIQKPIYEPDYYDIYCPHCGEILSIDSKTQEKEFMCPYCDNKINL